MPVSNYDYYPIGTIVLWRPTGQTWTRVVMKMDTGKWGWFGDVDLRRAAHVMHYSEVKKLMTESGMYIEAFIKEDE